MRYKTLLGVLVLLLGFSTSSQSDGGDSKIVESQISHGKWNSLLRKHVSVSGAVNYAAFQKDSVALNEYLKLVSEYDPNSEYLSEDARKAFWINAYNAFTVKLVITHYPLKSIRDLGTEIKIKDSKSPWDLKFIPIDGQLLSLNHIEHEILRKKFSDPRIHFAINCASISCPVLLNVAFNADRLETQLDAQARIFINDKSKNKIAANRLQISQLWQWFEGDFTKNGDLISYLNKFSQIKISAKAKIEYLEYDWNLNE